MLDLSKEEKKNKNKSLEKIQTKPKINNLKKINYSFAINKTNENDKIKKNKIIDENKIKDGLKKLNQSFEEKNKNILFKEENKQENDINNKSLLLDENKIKEEIKKINGKNILPDESKIKNNNLIEKYKIKITKDETSETNDESVSDKNKNKSPPDKKNYLAKNEIKIIENKEEIYKTNQNQNSPIKKKRIFLNNKKKVDLKSIIKKAYLFSGGNKGNENLVEQLECALDIDQYIQNEIAINKNDNLMTPEEAVYYIENVIIRFLGYFGSELSLKKIKTYIEKKPTNYILRDMTFKLICGGLATQKIYKLIIENEEKKIQIC